MPHSPRKHHIKARGYSKALAGGVFDRFPDTRRIGAVWVLELGEWHSRLYDPVAGKHLATFEGGCWGWPEAVQRRFTRLCKRKRLELACECCGTLESPEAGLGIAVVAGDSASRADLALAFRRHAPKNTWLDPVIVDACPTPTLMLGWFAEEFGLFGSTDEEVRVWVRNGPLAAATATGRC